MLQLLGCNPCQLVGRRHLLAQPFRRYVVAIRLGRRAEFEEDAREEPRVAQRFHHWTVFGNNGRAIENTFCAIGEAQFQLEVLKRLYLQPSLTAAWPIVLGRVAFCEFVSDPGYGYG